MTYFCVLDFEATCDDKYPCKNEIIEFPSILYKLTDGNLQYIDKFQEYCKPSNKLTEFCKNLTGIKQFQVDNSDTFPNILEKHQKWLLGFTNDVIIVTCGSWDLQKMFSDECENWDIEISELNLYHKFINIKEPVAEFFNIKKVRSLPHLLDILCLKFEGRHHSGIDDTKNIGRVLIQLFEEGFRDYEKYIYYF
jgi:inhibitor of KinA sporulation pathway (predicted exonuclease)